MRKMLEATDLPTPQQDDTTGEEPPKKAKGNWWIADDALWNPFEVISFVMLIVLGFGFLLGRGHYEFVMELFAPAIVFAIVMVIAQGVARHKAGKPNVFKVIRNRIR